MTKSDFEATVLGAFDVPLRSGMAKESSIASPYFGDASVVVAAPTFRVRVTRDRGLVSVDISSHERPEDWYPLEWAVALIRGGPPGPPGTIGLEEAASLVHTHAKAIGELVSGSRAKETRDRFNEFADERLASLERGEWPRPPS
jgi:hypothetical protein